jgi:hypothetical protein
MPITLSNVEGCAQSPRSNSCSWFVVVLVRISRSRFTDAVTMNGRLASEMFLSSLRSGYFSNLLAYKAPG